MIEVRGYEVTMRLLGEIVREYRTNIGQDISEDRKAEYRAEAEKKIAALGFSLGDARRWLAAPAKRRP